MSEGRKEVLRGHLEECVRHLGADIVVSTKGWREAAKLKRPGADFCGVTIDTMNRWFNGGPLPVGETLIKLVCYLDLIGYRVIELERMPKGRRNFAELVGYGLLSGKQASELLGYASPSTFYAVMQGLHEAGTDKDSKMWDSWKERKEELQNRKESALESCSLNASPEANLAANVSVQQMQASRQLATVNIMEGLSALLEGFVDGDLTDFKQSTDTVLRLSARLNDLSSRLLKGGG